MEIKICGIRREEDIAVVNRCKPDYIGFILAKGYRRTVDIQTAARLRKMLDSSIKAVGVFVNDDARTVEEYARTIGLDAVQLHGDEDEDYIASLDAGCEIWKAVRVRGGADICDVKGADRILLDKYDPNCYGGTGRVIDAGDAGEIKASVPIILAGGLSAENAAERIAVFKPECVDVSSSVETDGFKDENKVKEFIDTVRMI